jgi:hypothetical protein
VALRSPPSPMDEGRPLPPPSVLRFLPAGDRWRTVGSRRPAPRGFVPDDEAVDCVVSQSFGGEGAGPDGVSLSTFRAFSAKSVNLVVLFFFLPVLVVIWCSTDDLE